MEKTGFTASELPEIEELLEIAIDVLHQSGINHMEAYKEIIPLLDKLEAGLGDRSTDRGLREKMVTIFHDAMRQILDFKYTDKGRFLKKHLAKQLSFLEIAIDEEWPSLAEIRSELVNYFSIQWQALADDENLDELKESKECFLRNGFLLGMNLNEIKEWALKHRIKFLLLKDHKIIPKEHY